MEAGLERLNQKPIIDTMEPRALELIKSQVATNCSDGEVGYFLELAAHYDLDPFAREIWCIKNKGRLLIMVGRDGLRKIAQRQGLRIDCDVVRENDEFGVARGEDGRVVTHTYGKLAERGAIVGAWCEVTDTHGRPQGFFYAPLAEYRPANVNEHSPWAKQESVMILAAAERQALRQATPLGGMLAEGEMEPGPSVMAPVGDGSAQEIDLGPDVEAVIERATQLGHSFLSDRATLAVAIGGRGPDVVAKWVRDATAKLDEFEADLMAHEDGGDAAHGDVIKDVEVVEEGAAAILRHRLGELSAARVQNADAPDAVAEIDAEIDHVQGQLDALETPKQEAS
jgi:phage recombination protein Bet